MNSLNYLEDVSLLARSLGAVLLATPETTEGFTPQSKYETSERFPPRMFLFDYEDGNEINLSSETSDHTLENDDTNSIGIVNKPEEISTTGYIGELGTRIPDTLGGANVNKLKQQVNKLSLLSAYQPQLTLTAMAALQKAERLYRDAQYMSELATQKWASINPASNDGFFVITGTETAEQIADKVKKARNQTNQQKAFQEIYSYWKKKTLFTVRTPFAVFRNCAIISVRTKQDDDSKHKSSFQVKFKVMRMQAVQELPVGDNYYFDPNDSSPVMKSQTSPVIDKGPASIGEFTA